MTEEENIYGRIALAHSKNIILERRSDLWNWCVDNSNKVLTMPNLENMSINGITFGFFGGTSELVNRVCLLKLAQGLGVCGIHNPENCKSVLPKSPLFEASNDDILDEVQKELPFNIQPPEFIGGRTTTQTKLGIFTDRHYPYLWIAKRIIELFPDRSSRILEIGAGIGLLGYYLDKAGYKDYTTIDLAQANACQTFFLYKNLPHRQFVLSGESDIKSTDPCSGSFKILHSSDLPGIKKEEFDIVVNIDGLTEMNKQDAYEYIYDLKFKNLLSVNHEVNEYRVFDLCKDRLKLNYRYPFWIRDGYVEELYSKK